MVMYFYYFARFPLNLMLLSSCCQVASSRLPTAWRTWNVTGEHTQVCVPIFSFGLVSSFQLFTKAIFLWSNVSVKGCGHVCAFWYCPACAWALGTCSALGSTRPSWDTGAQLNFWVHTILFSSGCSVVGMHIPALLFLLKQFHDFSSQFQSCKGRRLQRLCLLCSSYQRVPFLVSCCVLFLFCQGQD